MNSTLVQQQLQLPYSRATWRPVLRELLPDLEFFAQDAVSPLTNEREREIATARRQFGRAILTDGKIVALYEIDLIPGAVDLAGNRVALRRLVADRIDQVTAHAVLAFFVPPAGGFYRLTYATRQSTFDLETLAVVNQETAPRRYTYVLGPGETRRTAASRLASLGEKRATATLADVTDAFSVERLNNEFFTRYKDHYVAFCEHLLANEALTAVFHLDLADKTGKELDRARKPVRDYVKKLLGRLVFLSFLQKKGWLGCPALPPAQAAMPQEAVPWIEGQGDFIRRLFDSASPSGQDHFHSTRLVPLFFDTLNDSHRAGHLFGVTGTRVPYLNGGLFERDFVGVDALDFPAVLFRDLFDFFGQYHFTIDENDPEEQEIGIDPEMLGHIFENLLEDNKDKGAYYTPKAVVQYMAQQSLIHALSGRFPNDSVARDEIEKLIRFKEPIDSRDSQSWLATHATQVAVHLDELKICDPAIGSGAFPIGLLQEIYWTQLTLNPALDRASAKRLIIQHSIYGVDLDAGAVEIARLRFWLALIVDEHVPRPLPNLDYQIMQGNSLLESFEGERLDMLDQPVRYGIQRLGSNAFELPLAGAGTDSGEMTITVHTPAQHGLAELQRRYFACHEPEAKTRLRAEIDAVVLRAIDARFTLRREELEASLHSRAAFIGRAHQRGGDKQRASMQAELDALTGKSASLHDMLANIRAERPFFLWHFWFREIFERNGGFDIVIANPPYIPMETMAEDERQIFRAAYAELTRKFDSAAVFLLHGLGLLKPGGCLTLISPVTWQTGENYADLRKTIFRKAGLLQVINLPFDIFTEAYVDTCIYLITTDNVPSYRITLLPKRAKVGDLAAVPFVEVASDLVCEPNFKLVLNPVASALLKRIFTSPSVLVLGAISKSTQGLAGNRFRRESDGKIPMAFAEDVSVARYAITVRHTSVVDMSEHRSLSEFYKRGPKFLIRRIINRQDRLVVGRCDDEIVFKKDVSPFLLTDRSIEPNYLLSLLNSRLLSWLYVNTSSIATKDDFRQTTLAELRALPIPIAGADEQVAMSTLVDQIIAAKRVGDEVMVAALEAQIDAHVFSLYGLTPEEISLVQNGIS